MQVPLRSQVSMAKRMRRFLLVSLALCFSALATDVATLDTVLERGIVRIGWPPG